MPGRVSSAHILYDRPDHISDSILVARRYILGFTGCADNSFPDNPPKDKTVLLDAEAFLAAAATIPLRLMPWPVPR